MRLRFLSAPEDVDLAALNQYFVALRNRTKSSLDGMLHAYRTLRNIRQSFGLPVTTQPGEASPDPGALPDSLFQQLLEVSSMADIGIRALDDVVANRRKVNYDAAAQTWQVERLPDDQVRIENRGGVPTPVSNATNQPMQIAGTIDGLGLAPIAWVALGVAGVIVTVGALYTVNTAMESATVMVQAHTQKTIAIKSMELVEQRLANPEQAVALQKGTYQAAADLEEARGSAAAKTGLTPDTNRTIRTVAIVAAIGGVIYLVARVLPQRRAAFA